MFMTSFSFFFDIFVCFTGKRNHHVQRRDTGHADQTHRAVQEDGGQHQWSVFPFSTRGNLDKGLPLLWDGVPQIIYYLYCYSLQMWALRCSPVGLLFTSEEQKKKSWLIEHEVLHFPPWLWMSLIRGAGHMGCVLTSTCWLLTKNMSFLFCFVSFLLIGPVVQIHFHSPLTLS